MLKIFIKFWFFLLAAVTFFLLTVPSTMPLAFLVVPILLVFGLLYYSSYLLITLWPLSRVSNRTARILAVMVGLIGGLFMILQSSGGVIFVDLILVGPLVITIYIYITKF